MHRATRTIQIRNVPEQVHREVKARAAKSGVTLSDFLLAEVERIVAAPPIDQLLAEFRDRERPSLVETPAEAVRLGREAR